ncbi:hypothetical protein KJ693_10595 [bacterium]|nr:hypothetical protein [bacterium]MBU1615738.1 hypothetical protein [bacterium]
MEINKIIEETNEVAGKYNLRLVEIDQTDNIISLKLPIDNELFIRIYGNAEKDKLNLALVFRKRRLYGYDSEGGRYHYHPFDNPDEHIFIDDRKPIQDFVGESMKFLEESGIL